MNGASLFSFSSAGRVHECPASAAYPQTDTSSPYAELGSIRHRYLELVPKVGAEAALSEIRSTYGESAAAACELVDLDALTRCSADFGQEVALCLDVRSGGARELGRSIGRDYSRCTIDEVPGTLDVVGVAPDHVLVADYKFGRVTGLVRASDSLQLAAGAVAASRAYGPDHALIERIFVDETGEPHVSRAELDCFDLAERGELLERTVDRARYARSVIADGGRPELREGEWCRYCPAYSDCPAKTSLAIRLATGAEADELELITRPISREMWGVVFDRVAMAKKLIAEIEKRLHGAIEQFGAVPLEGGRVAELRETQREYLNGEITYRVLSEIYGHEVALGACELKTSKAAVTDLVRPFRGKGATIKRLVSDVVEAARDRKGVEVKTSRAIKVSRHDDPCEIGDCRICKSLAPSPVVAEVLDVAEGGS